MIIVSVTEFRKNISHYIKLSASENIHITRKGKTVAVLSHPDKEYSQNLLDLYGCLKDHDTGEDYDKMIGQEIMRRCGY